MEGVWDQGDDEVVLGDSGVEGLCVVDIEGGGLGVLDAGGELLGGLKGPAGCGEARERPSRLALGANEGKHRHTSLATGLGECGSQGVGTVQVTRWGCASERRERGFAYRQ